MSRRALISVYNKDGVLELARFLAQSDWEILSTGGTATTLRGAGLAVTDVSEVTGFPECLDGRVKTLHPAVHAGLLARRDNKTHVDTLAELDIKPIDLVCVNLYPFFDKVQDGLPFQDTVEFIDIGGPAMLRSAAKNFQDVIVLTDPGDYAETIAGIKAGDVPADFRRRLAGKVFNLTSAYDAAVSRFFTTKNTNEDFLPYYTLSIKKAQVLRYGENAHQKAALYLAADEKGAFGGMTQHQGKELSYNNIRDLDIAWKAVCGYQTTKHTKNTKGEENKGVFTIALKHNSPCGAAVGETALDSYRRTFECDPVSIFGGIIGVSAVVDEDAAAEMVKTFLEVVVAPGFTDGARKVFETKKNLRVITAEVPVTSGNQLDVLSVAGGLLVQSRDDVLFEKWDIVTQARPTPEQESEMGFGMVIAQFAKSNAIVVVKDKAAIGIGAGQTNRIWAAEQALSRAKAVTDAKGEAPATVLVSDAFFPFRDCVDAAAKAGIKAIVQPGGSLRDQESVDACNEHGIAMVFTGARHFKH